MTSAQKAPIPEFGVEQAGVDYIDRPGVYAVIENNDRQIAIIETRNGYLLPGGGIDGIESDVEALKREILEEIGYHATVLEKIGEAVEYIKPTAMGRIIKSIVDFIKCSSSLKLEKRLKRIIISSGYGRKMLVGSLCDRVKFGRSIVR